MKTLRQKTIFGILFLVTQFSIASSQEQAKQSVADIPESKPESWQLFTSPEGQFSAEFPGKPSLTSRLAGSERQAKLYMYSVGTQVAYGVSYFDLPGAETGPDAAKKALELAKQGLTQDYGSEQLTVSEVTVEGYPARLLIKKLRNGYTLKVKTLVAGNRQYQVSCALPSSESVGPINSALYESAVNRFMDSFHLISTGGELSEIDLWLKNHKGSRIVYGACQADDPNCQPAAEKLGNPNAETLVLGRALVLTKPAYPAIARAAHASGTIAVQVIIDDTGRVVAAKAISGNPLLYSVSVQAARDSRFTPPTIDTKPVCVMGVITYNFVAQ